MSTLTLQQSFCAAYREHLSWMLHTVRRLGVPDADSEDVAHDVFSTAWKRLDAYVPERPMKPWLFGIATRVISNRKSNKKGQEELTAEFDAVKGNHHGPDKDLEGEVTRKHVLRALDSLPLEQRVVFVGADIDEVAITELAEQLQIPLNTAYSRLRLARQRFQTVFEQLQSEVRA